MRTIPRLRPGWASVVCLAPMCVRRARTKMGACLIPSHKEWVQRAHGEPPGPAVCDFKRWGDYCPTCVKVRGDVG